MKKMKNILIANGVNLDLLGTREPEIYGTQTLADLEKKLRKNQGCTLEFFQTNSEESFLSKITGPWDAVIINPGAWTHTSLALSDRIKGLPFPFVEVHLSHLFTREAIRQVSLTAGSCIGFICGFGLDGYAAALELLVSHLIKKHGA